MKHIRVKALTVFSRNIAGSIVHGDPDHPYRDGKFPLVTTEQAEILADAGLVKKATAADRAAFDDVDNGDEGLSDDDDAATGISNVQGASTAGTGAVASAQQVRDARTDTNTVGETGAARRKPAKNTAPAANEAGGAPAGGHDTNASTNHPSTARNGDGTTSATNAGATSDPDAPPTE